MDKDQKTAHIEEIAAGLSDAAAVFAVDYRGISVPQAAELRGRLNEADATFKVVKNRLAKRALEKAGTEGLEELLEGPTALALIKGDPVVAAKTISNFARDNDVLVFKGGIMDGAPLAPDQFVAIARLPGVDTLRGQLVGLAASPLTGLAAGLNDLISGLGRQLAQMADQGLVTGEAPAPPEDAPAEEPAAEAEEASAEDEPAEEADEAPAAEGGEGEEAPADEPAAEGEETPAEEPSAAEGSDPETTDAPEAPAADEGSDPTEEEAPAEAESNE